MRIEAIPARRYRGTRLLGGPKVASGASDQRMKSYKQR
jgi:hypothetical protein